MTFQGEDLMPHTPGPWDCEMRAPAGIKWDAIIRSKEKRNPICTVFMAGYMAKEADANAHLIAAAPEMLAALQALVTQISEYERINNLAPNPGRKYCWDTTEQAATAIAKATGQQS